MSFLTWNLLLGLLFAGNQPLGWQEEMKVLEETYQASNYLSYRYEPSAEELQKAREPFQLAVNRDFDRALRLYQELLREYPESWELHADYVFFLDRRGRAAEAARFARESANKFPKSIKLRIIADSFQKIAATRSRQQRADYKQEMDALLAAWTQMQIQATPRKSGSRTRSASSD